MNSPKHLHVALASDNNYAEFVAIVLTSLFATNIKFDKISIHLLSNNIQPHAINHLDEIIKTNNGDFFVYNISDIKARLNIKVPNTIAISAYSRLFLAEIISMDIDKIVYLDCDIIINNDLSEIWSVALENYHIGAVLDTLPDNKSKITIGLSHEDEYINSGMLLINLKKWREDKIQEKFINFLLKHNGNVHHHDQGIINAICKKKLILHPKYNLSSSYLSHPYWLLNKTNTPFYTETEVIEAKENPVIVHFTEGFYNRPWIANSKHPLAYIFEKYWGMANWGEIIYRPDKRSKAVKMLSWSFLNLPHWAYNMISNSISLIHKLIKG